MAYAENTVAEQGKQPYKYNSKELDKIHGLNLYDYEARYMEPALGRFTSFDPHAEKYYSASPYICVANDPIRAVDPTGMDSIQRLQAVDKSQEYVDKKKSGNQYLMGAKGKPGEKVDCSGLVSASVSAGGEKDPNHGNKTSGVLNIESNTKKITDSEVKPGNIISFRSSKGYPYHIGVVENVNRNEVGDIVTVDYIHSSGGKGPNKATYVMSSNGTVSVDGFYKWDSKPDPILTIDSSIKGYITPKQKLFNSIK